MLDGYFTMKTHSSFTIDSEKFEGMVTTKNVCVKQRVKEHTDLSRGWLNSEVTYISEAYAFFMFFLYPLPDL
jgi:hypothetical protein